MDRRSFVQKSALATAAFTLAPTIVPRHVLGGIGFRAPSDKVNVAAIGAGGMGASNMMALVDEAIVALADVDFATVDRNVESRVRNRDGVVQPQWAALQEAYGKARRYADFRELLSRETDLDGVVIATPDHVHAIAALHAMQRGLAVYVQKPLTYSVEEARALKAAAAKTGVVTQMGNQGHSGDDGRRTIELIRSGIIGPVREVLSWTDRPRGWWPQGTGWPEPQPVPDTVDWDLYLGPNEEMPYYPGIHPFGWRGWVDFGVAALGDMGAHILDFPYWGLELDRPTRIETRHSPWGGPPDNRATYPVATITTFEFERPGGPMNLTWFDGGLMPPTPRIAPEGFQLSAEGGSILVGERGLLIHDTYGRNPRLLPESLEAEAAAIPQTLPRIAGGHEQNWIRAIRGEEEASSPFAYAADLTETMLLGIVALHAGRPLSYDAANMTIPNAPDAERFLRRPYRDGWSLPVI